MLSVLKLTKRLIPIRVDKRSALYSSSCVQINPDFDAKIEFLKNKLYPDSLIKVLQSTDDISSAIKIFKWVSLQKKFNHTSDTYYWIILKLGLASNVHEMEGFVQNMIKDNKCLGVENVLVLLIEEFVRHCRLNEAICVLLNMCLGGFKPSINVFNLVLDGVVKEKRGLKDVVFVYKEMVKAGVAPTVDTLNYLTEVLFYTKRVDSALNQYRRISKKGCNPNSRTFEIVIKGLVENNQVDDSVVILCEMVKLGCVLDLNFYTCVIPLLCRENKIEEAIGLFRTMRILKSVPNAVIYSALIQRLCKNHQLDDAIKLVEEMLESCLIPDNNVLVDIVNEFCRLGKINEAVKFLRDKNIFETSPHNALLEGCCNVGKLFMAKEHLREMSEGSIDDSDSWNALIRWLCEKAEIRKASELLGRMIVSSFLPNKATYSALVLGYCRSNECESALKCFLRLCSQCWVLDSVSYSELIEGLCRAGKHLEATKVFYYMFANECFLQPISFNTLIKSICEKGMVIEALRLQQMAHNSGMCDADATCSYIMLGLSNTDGGRNILVFLSQMVVKGYNLDAEAYCILIKSMIAQNRVRDCAVYWTNMVNKGLIPDSDTLNNLLSYLANGSQFYLISATIGKLVHNSQVLDSAMYNILINGFWREGLKNEACQLLDLMLERGWVPDAATHKLLVGSIGAEESDDKTYETKDGVMDILVEGLGET